MTLLEQIQHRLSNLSPDKQREVLDFVAFLQANSLRLPEPTADEKRAKRIKDLLTQLGTMNVFAGIGDPADWQRKVRNDRSLPGRTA